MAGTAGDGEEESALTSYLHDPQDYHHRQHLPAAMQPMNNPLERCCIAGHSRRRPGTSPGLLHLLGIVDLTREQILALAPDASSVSAGRGLADARHWTNLGRAEHALWGECKGSGALPYQARIDLREPAFKCTCPSRKFPCKHALGLMLLAAASPTALPESEAPTWVSDWLAKRDGTVARKEARADDEPVDPETVARRAAAATKRSQSRDERIDAGIDELTVFLGDIVRQGILALPGRPFRFWDSMAARMVDAQAPGLASALRELGSVVAAAGDTWQTTFLERLARLSLIIQGWKARDTLTPDLLADVRSAVGIATATESLAALPSVADHWRVVGQWTDDSATIRTQRSWLVGTTSGQTALFLQFAPQNQPFAATVVPGTVIEGSLTFFPSATPLRATWSSAQRVIPWNPWHAQTLSEATAHWTTRLAKGPLLERIAFVVGPVVPVFRNGAFFVIDENRHEWPVRMPAKEAWRLMAVSGGHRIDICGEWDGTSFVPLASMVEQRFIRLTSNRAS